MGKGFISGRACDKLMEIFILKRVRKRLKLVSTGGDQAFRKAAFLVFVELMHSLFVSAEHAGTSAVISSTRSP